MKNTFERSFHVMASEEKHLETKIRLFEDMLLRKGNTNQTDAIQIELQKNEETITKVILSKNRRQITPLFFLF